MATMPAKKNPESSRQLQTCDVCKLRHQKCSGDRPSCFHCNMRNLQCVYSTVPAHNVDRSVVRKRSPQPEDEQWELRSPDSENLTTRDAAPSVLVSVVFDAPKSPSKSRKRPRIDEETSKPKGPRSSMTASLTYLVDTVKQLATPRVPISSIGEYQRAQLGTSTHDLELWKFGEALSRQSSEQRNLPSKVYAQSLLELFLNGINSLIFVCDPVESQSQLSAVLAENTVAGDDVKALVHLQLCLGAASADNFSDDECEALFVQGCEHLEMALERVDQDWLWVAQVTLLKGIHELSRKPAKAYLALGSAIKIAQTYRIDLSFEDSFIQTKEEYSKWRQLWLSMITIDAWLSSILGRIPQITPSTSKDPFLENLNLNYGIPECTVQTCIAKMGVVICRMLKDVHGGKQADIRLYDRYMAFLERWVKGIPLHLQIARDSTERTKMPPQDQTLMFQLKVVHLGGILLLTRPLLLQCVAMEQQQPPVKPDSKTREHAQTCVDAAVRISYCCSAMKERGLLPKRSWQIIYLVFTSALVIMINTIRRGTLLIADPRQAAREAQEESSLNTCFEILEFCAERDHLAKHFSQILHPLWSAILARRSFQLNMPSLMPQQKNLAPISGLQRPSLGLPGSSSSSSACVSISTSASPSTGPSSAISPSSMDGLEFAGAHQAFPDTSFLHPTQDALFSQEMSQGYSFEDIDDWNMDDWFVAPQDQDERGSDTIGQLPGTQ